MHTCYFRGYDTIGLSDMADFSWVPPNRSQGSHKRFYISCISNQSHLHTLNQ